MSTEKIVEYVFLFALVCVVLYSNHKSDKSVDDLIKANQKDNEELKKEIEELRSSESSMKLIEAPRNDDFDTSILDKEPDKVIDAMFRKKEIAWAHETRPMVIDSIDGRFNEWHELFNDGEIPEDAETLKVRYYASDLSKGFIDDSSNDFEDILAISANQCDGFFYTGLKTSKGFQIVTYYDPRYLFQLINEDSEFNKKYSISMLDSGDWSSSFETAKSSMIEFDISEKERSE